jgi:hypothetical protein
MADRLAGNRRDDRPRERLRRPEHRRRFPLLDARRSLSGALRLLQRPRRGRGLLQDPAGRWNVGWVGHRRQSRRGWNQGSRRRRRGRQRRGRRSQGGGRRRGRRRPGWRGWGEPIGRTWRRQRRRDRRGRRDRNGRHGRSGRRGGNGRRGRRRVPLCPSPLRRDLRRQHGGGHLRFVLHTLQSPLERDGHLRRNELWIQLQLWPACVRWGLRLQHGRGDLRRLVHGVPDPERRKRDLRRNVVRRDLPRGRPTLRGRLHQHVAGLRRRLSERVAQLQRHVSAEHQRERLWLILRALQASEQRSRDV